MSHPALSELLTDEDQKIFKYLSKLEVEDCKDHFESNPYSEDAMLTKTFTFFEEGTTEISAKAITWKEGMGIPIGVAAEEKKGNKRPKAEESFFSWFNNIQHSSNLEEIHDEQVAEIIKDDLWPNPLTYFNNEAADEEGSEMDDDEDKESDGSEDDDDQDDDENEG
ncbi:NAP1-related protein 1-like isoform X3 [Salvia splendens]|uniref:NAP1-related protein 1-like isoform X3 n=1 Tax=Salvia splendens TaxID=180675 RepID=UPI001C260F7D|nr:NAP1-related protein 1-like isoform X3 [Salvia splendens]